jgi:hypothetical protein
LRRVTERSQQVLLAKQAEKDGWTVKETERRVDSWLTRRGYDTDRRKSDRRTAGPAAVDPFGHVWHGLRTSLNGHPARCDVSYQGKNRWTVEVRAEDGPNSEHLAELFSRMAQEFLPKSSKPVKKPAKRSSKKR